MSFGSFFVKKRNLTIMVSVFLIAGILFNIYYQYSYEKDYLSEFTEQGEALDKLETGTDLAVLDTEDSSLYRYDQMGTHTYENSSMQMGTNSASYYFSVTFVCSICFPFFLCFARHFIVSIRQIFLFSRKDNKILYSSQTIQDRSTVQIIVLIFSAYSDTFHQKNY